MIQEQLESTVDGDKRTSVSAAAAGRAPWCPAPLVLADGPGRRRGGRSGRGRIVPFHKCVWIHATQLHDVEQPGEVVRTDPSREGETLEVFIAWKTERLKEQKANSIAY